MYSKIKIKSIISPFIMAAVAVLFMGSCTVYKYVDAPREDGIYSPNREYRGQANNYSETNSYYKQYFQSKQGTYSEILDEEESAIFTDIDAYNTREYIGEDGYVYSERVSQEEAYGGWGTNATNVSVNIYGGGYGAYYNPFYYNSFYGHWGYPYYRNSYYYPRWYVGGFSWWYGWNGFYSPFYYSSYYHTPYYTPYRPYYNHVAQNRGRRNTNYSPRATTSGRSSATTTARGRSALGTNARRGTNTDLSRRNTSTIGNDARRNSSINNTIRRNDANTRRSTNSNLQRATTPTSRRVTFPQRSNVNNKTTPTRTQSTRRTPVQSRPTQQSTRQQPSTRQQRPAMRSSMPTRSSSPSMRSTAPTRSVAPASRGGRSSGGRR